MLVLSAVGFGCGNEGGVGETADDSCPEGHERVDGSCQKVERDACPGGAERLDGECIDPDACNDRCSGRGVCIAEEDTTSCECEQGFAGPSCEECALGYHQEGDDCRPDTSCSDDSCAGRGSCLETGDGISCSCDEGFAGTACELCDESDGYHEDGHGGCAQDPCLPDQCTQANRTECSVSEGDVTCRCDEGYHLEGDDCAPDEVCDGNSCGAHGG